MSKPTLIIMAAGMGSRYGGLKQIDPVGLHGELIIDYSIYDALQAGFGKVVFVIKKSIENDFREVIGSRIEKQCETTYVFQEMDKLPDGFTVPAGRKKPWGTGHAALMCKGIVNEPFAIINADDFYGATSFKAIYNQLSVTQDANSLPEYCMVGYELERTLTKHGHVSRGVCTADQDGYLVDIHERTRIQRFGELAKYSEDDGATWVDLPLDSIVSLNMWGFTPTVFNDLESEFHVFLEQRGNELKSEFFLPSVVNTLLKTNLAKIKVIPTKERWVGVTYQADKPIVEQYVLDRIKNGIYPQKLWG